MKTHITTLNNMAGTASLAHRRVLKVAQSIGCHEMGLSFYHLKPDYAKEIDKRLDGIIAPLNYGDIVIFQYPSWIGVNYDESFVNKIKSYRDTKLIIFVQDIQKLMFDSEQAILDMEIRTLNKADLLILPSKKMHRYLKENGLDEKPVIYQTIWDMPSDICFVDHAVTRCFHFAGNYNRFPFLAEYHGKTPIYQYDANKPDRENDDSFCWRGYLEQEKLMHELSKGGFGLVWSDDEYFDRYYSMNQPYKLGTNLAAGIPVIVKRGCVHEKSQTSLIILTAYRIIRSMAGAVAERKIAIKIPIHSNTHPCLTDTFLTTSPTSWTLACQSLTCKAPPLLAIT